MGMEVLQWASEQVMMESQEERVILSRALVVVLAKQRVAVISLGIVISGLASKALRSGSAGLRVSQARLAKEVVADQRGAEAGVVNLVGAVGEAVG